MDKRETQPQNRTGAPFTRSFDVQTTLTPDTVATRLRALALAPDQGEDGRGVRAEVTAGREAAYSFDVCYIRRGLYNVSPVVQATGDVLPGVDHTRLRGQVKFNAIFYISLVLGASFLGLPFFIPIVAGQTGIIARPSFLIAVALIAFFWFRYWRILFGDRDSLVALIHETLAEDTHE